MKGAGQNNWLEVSIGEICEATATIDPRKFPKEEFEYVDVSSVSNETFTIEQTHRLFGADAPSRARRQIRSGDILFATIRPTLQRIAQVPEYLDDQVCSTGYVVLRPKPELNARFLMYALFRPEFTSAMETLQSGASYPAVTDKQVRAQKVPIPPLEEQQRIVAILDEAFEGLDRARAHAEANLQSAQEVFESFISEIFRSRDWPVKGLHEVSENLDRLRVPITKKDRVEGPIPYYGASGVVDHVADFLFDEDLLLVSEDGANLLARTYPIAFSISGKTWVNNHAHVLRFAALDTQEFVRLYLNSISLEPFVSGMAQPKLNQSQLNRIPIPFPDLDTRKMIVERAGILASKSAELRENYQASIEDLDDLRLSLLNKAFAGELTARAFA